MKKLLLLMLGSLLFLTACGGSSGGSPNDSPPTFTSAMLDGSPAFYTTSPGSAADGNAGGTTQQVISFTGNSPTYSASAEFFYFDASDSLLTEDSQGPFDVVIEANGTLTIAAAGVTFTLASETPTYLELNGVDVDGSFTDLWYKDPPVGWLPTTSDPTIAFTDAMLNGSPTFYVSYPGDVADGNAGGTTQETIAVTGTAPSYSVAVNRDYFSSTGTVVSSDPEENFTAVLETNGTFTVAAFSTTLSLVSETATYLQVKGVDATDTWIDEWYFTQPAGWLTAGSPPAAASFLASDFSSKIVYYIWSDSAGTLGAGGWDGATLSFASNGTATGEPTGIVDPYPASPTITGASWSIDSAGRLNLVVPSEGVNDWYTLLSRDTNYFDVCYGTSAAAADVRPCTESEYFYFDLAAAQARVLLAP